MTEGSFKCENCGKDVEWYFFDRQPLSSHMYVEEAPKGENKINVDPYQVDEHKYIIRCYCKNCGRMNYHEHTV